MDWNKWINEGTKIFIKVIILNKNWCKFKN